MTKKELTEWFMNDFWPVYLNLMKVPKPSKWGAGDRGEALKKMLTLNPGEDLRKRILAALSAQMAHRKKLYDKCGSIQSYLKKVEYNKFYCNKNGKTWIFNMGWEAEIPSLSDERIEQTSLALQCKTNDCDNKALGKRVPYCQSCEHKLHQQYFPLMRDYLRRHNLTKCEDESMHDYVTKCKKHTGMKYKNIKTC